MLAPSFSGSPRCTFTLTKKVAVPAAILFRSISIAAARISASGAPTNVAFSPSPIHLLTAFNNLWLSHKYSNGSSISVSWSANKTLLIQVNLSWSPLPHVPLGTAAFSFSFSTYILLPFCLVCLNRHLPLFGPETHSLRACLSLCSSSNRVPSLSIKIHSCLFLLILWPLSSKLLFPRLAHSNLGEPNTKHTLRSLRIWCFSIATTLSSALTALCLLSYPSFLLLWLLLACVLRRFLFHRLQTVVALRLFSSTCTKPPNPSTCPSFPTTTPAPIPINFPILPR